MQDLRIILIILGAVAIAALLIHGLWTSQKGRQKPLRDKPLTKVSSKTPDANDSKFDEFDSDGIGRVRVVGNHQAASLSRDHEIEDDWQISSHFSSLSDDADEPSLGLPPTLSTSVFAEDPEDEVKPTPDFVAQRAEQRNIEAQKRTAALQGTDGARASRERNAGQPPMGESAAELRARQYRQGEIDPLFDNHEPVVAPPADTELETYERAEKDVYRPAPAFNRPAASVASPSPAKVEPVAEPIAPEPNIEPEAIAPAAAKPVAAITKTWQDVYVVNLMAKPNQTIAGIDLIRAVTQVGFIFGDMDIFHRYQGSSTQGEPLFSLANMVNPGTFTPDAMSEFTTPGVSIFMQLPKPGMAKNHFNMMIQAADNMKEDLDAVLLDGQRQPLSLDYLVRCRSQLNDFDSQA
ncbi:cell division protein ZipA [Oceanisphaera sp. W20_SRM_FM3]|uniref:cell division protein ZipA n=1 Tax=Oceanisphaera sp. W20_SRM_FM3 TaxID=3240267 RepID=UPI003F9538C1